MAPNCTTLVALDSLVLKDNVRTDDCMEIQQMVDSLHRWGFQNNHPLVVHDEGDGTYLVLRGNRRTIGLRQIQTENPEKFAEILPSGRIPAIVHKGLTESEKVLIRIDHSSDEDRVPLSKAAEFQAVKQLVLANAYGDDNKIAESGIAEKLGWRLGPKSKTPGAPNRSYAQPYIALAKLPGFVQEAYLNYWMNPAENPVPKTSAILTLSKVYRMEMAEFPDGDGPAFQEAWKVAMTPKDKKDKKDSFTFTPRDAKERVPHCRGSLTKKLMLAVTGQGPHTIKNVDDMVVSAEEAVRIVSILREYHGDDGLRDLVKEAEDAISIPEPEESEEVTA